MEYDGGRFEFKRHNSGFSFKFDKILQTQYYVEIADATLEPLTLIFSKPISLFYKKSSRGDL